MKEYENDPIWKLIQKELITDDEIAYYTNKFCTLDLQHRSAPFGFDPNKIIFITRIESEFPDTRIFYVDEEIVTESSIKIPHRFFKRSVKIIT